jgi:hypothetical protein
LAGVVVAPAGAAKHTELHSTTTSQFRVVIERPIIRVRKK